MAQWETVDLTDGVSHHGVSDVPLDAQEVALTRYRRGKTLF